MPKRKPQRRRRSSSQAAAAAAWFLAGFLAGSEFGGGGGTKEQDSQFSNSLIIGNAHVMQLCITGSVRQANRHLGRFVMIMKIMTMVMQNGISPDLRCVSE
jgi:hypothetical protein